MTEHTNSQDIVTYTMTCIGTLCRRRLIAYWRLTAGCDEPELRDKLDRYGVKISTVLREFRRHRDTRLSDDELVGAICLFDSANKHISMIYPIDDFLTILNKDESSILYGSLYDYYTKIFDHGTVYLYPKVGKLFKLFGVA